MVNHTTYLVTSSIPAQPCSEVEMIEHQIFFTNRNTGYPLVNHRKTIGKWWFDGILWEIPSGKLLHNYDKSQL